MTLFPLPLDPAVIMSEGLPVGFRSNMVPFRTGLGYSYRVLDIDDVILNVAGVLLGYAAWRLAAGEIGVRPTGGLPANSGRP